MMSLARSTMMIAAGDLAGGWDAYEARFDPHYADVTHFMVDRPAWTPDSDLRGKKLLIMGEQGFGGRSAVRLHRARSDRCHRPPRAG